MVVEPRAAVYDGNGAVYVGLCRGYHRQSGRVPDIEAVAEVERFKVSDRVVDEAGNRPLTATDGKRQERNIVRASGGEPCGIGNDRGQRHVDLHDPGGVGGLAGVNKV